MLHNGALFEGAVERSPEGVSVEGNGSLIRLRNTEVAFVGGSSVEAYEWKRAQVGQGGLTVEDHLALADWALQNRLLPQAARELLDARQLAPASRRLELLERRLDEAIRPKTPHSSPAQPNPAATDDDPQPAPTEAVAEKPNRPALPAGALEQFTRRIQPVLLNSCATSGCHGAKPAGGFELDLAPLRGYGDLRSTERNLHAALDLIDVQMPQQSKLLTTAVGPHAGTTPVTGARREEMLQRLAVWIESIAFYNAPPAVEQPAAAAGVAESSPPPMVDRPNTDKSIDEQAEPDWEAIVAAEESRPAEVQHGATLKRVEPRDEFDPAVFNARYRRPQDDLPISE